MRIRSNVESFNRVSQQNKAALKCVDYPPCAELCRPRTRADCVNVPRPCPWISCQFNLFLDVLSNGSIVYNSTPDFSKWMPEESCALDFVDKHPGGGKLYAATLEEIGDLLNVTRERIRQIEAKGIRKLEDYAKRYRTDFERPDNDREMRTHNGKRYHGKVEG